MIFANCCRVLYFPELVNEFMYDKMLIDALTTAELQLRLRYVQHIMNLHSDNNVVTVLFTIPFSYSRPQPMYLLKFSMSLCVASLVESVTDIHH